MDFQIIQDALPEIVTQLVAFLAVLWILKKYAFGAVFKVLEERQKTIANDLAEAEKQKTDMEVLKKDYQQRIQVIEQEARQKILESVQEGQKVAEDIRSKASKDAEALVNRAKRDIDIEVDKAKATMRKQVVDLSTQIAGKLISKNLSSKENESYIQGMLDKTGDFS